MAAGKFIVLEGSEGAGKSTHLEGIQAQLLAAGRPVRVTREPGGTALGEQLRQLLLSRETRAMEPMTELLLMFAARRQHLTEVIQPALREGVWVVSDRFVDSSYAYQGGGRGLAASLIADLERLCLEGVRPHLTLLLDLDPQLGLARTGRQGTVMPGQPAVGPQLGLERAGLQGEADRFESEGLAFFTAVREVFLQRAKASPSHRVVDASQPLPAVQERVAALVQELLADG